MAEIIQIGDRLAKRPKRSVPASGAAKILLFTGVRYEKVGDGPHPGCSGPQQAKKR